MAFMVILTFCLTWLFMGLAIAKVVTGDGEVALNFVFAMLISVVAYALLAIAWRER